MLRRTFLSIFGLAVTATAGTSPAAAAPEVEYPPTIAMPPGVVPDGIVMIGKSPHAFVGSRHDGAIYRVDLQHGAVTRFRPGRPGGQAHGLALDRRGRLFVAGGASATMAEVLDYDTGARLAAYPKTGPFSRVDDVALWGSSAWFLDANRPELHRLQFGADGALPAAAVRIPIPGELVHRHAGDVSRTRGDLPRTRNDVNGIVVTPDQSALLVVQAATGIMYRVTEQGVSSSVDLGGETVAGGDGMVLGSTGLYVVQSGSALVTKVEIDEAGTTGRIVSRTADPRFVHPAGITEHHNVLYLTNVGGAVRPGSPIRGTVESLPAP